MSTQNLTVPARDARPDLLKNKEIVDANAWLGRPVLFSLVLYKMVFFTLICGALWLFPDLNKAAYNTCIHWPRNSGPTQATHLATWDGAHYLFLGGIGWLLPAADKGGGDLLSRAAFGATHHQEEAMALVPRL